MMSLFCCSNIKPYRPEVIEHEAKFLAFIQWAAFPRESAIQGSANESSKLAELDNPYVIQLVRQVNYGALESKRYYVTVEAEDTEQPFIEVTEADLIEANYKKLNT
jgi:hypothetical protein